MKVSLEFPVTLVKMIRMCEGEKKNERGGGGERERERDRVRT